ncbi:unnamed protein product [Dicrocoelium dendriticum]|nr:unnamed protein product [Dicrocoelium dendriticum]
MTTMRDFSESATDIKRPQFGGRHLSDETCVFNHNAWDDVHWTEEVKERAVELVSTNTNEKLPPEVREIYEKNSSKYWDQFYRLHENRFFKSRSWLPTEFPELFNTVCESADRSVIFEVGCGTGSTTLPIIRDTKNTFVYASDFSPEAVDCLRQSPEFDPSRCHAFVFDVTSEEYELPFPLASLDFVLIVFVLSAIDPQFFHKILANLTNYLKPGGMILFRDYGRLDMAQLRFKKGKCLADNFYLRSDGTRVYFFEQEELRRLFEGCGLEEVQNRTDRRLLVNRKQKLQMYRVWIQCKYRKN